MLPKTLSVTEMPSQQERGNRGKSLDLQAPVTLVAHDPTWQAAFAYEGADIRVACSGVISRVHHVGSTSIPGILAKPTIDILGETADFERVQAKTLHLAEIGYEALGPYGMEGRRYFRKRDQSGKHTFHLHVFEESSPHLERMISFRDYLIAHPKIAKDYSDLKRRLVSENSFTRAAYVEGKDPFIREVERSAVAWARARRDADASEA